MVIRISDIIEFITSPAEPVEPTVDKLETGNPRTEVKGIAVTFLAGQEIIDEALALGCNLIISHEGLFYSHWDKKEKYGEDSVYREKLELIEQSGIAVFRFHDSIHHYNPDFITNGLLRALGWQDYEIKNEPACSALEIPRMKLQDLLAYIKNKLEVPYLRYTGDTSSVIKRIGVFVGYGGTGETVIPAVGSADLDLVICGEGPEWETPEYIRDAMYQGKNRALIVLGHAESEAPSMEYFAGKLAERFPSIPVRYIPAKPVFRLF